MVHIALHGGALLHQAHPPAVRTGPLGHQGIEDAAADVLDELAAHGHLLLHDRRYPAVVHRIAQVVARLGGGEITLHGHVHAVLATDTALLLEAAMVGEHPDAVDL